MVGKMREKRGVVKSSPLSAVAILVFCFLMLIFGLFFLMGQLPDEPLALFFQFLWFIFCIGGIIYSIVILGSYSKDDKTEIPLAASDVIEIQEENRSLDFDERLRKLESLKNDNLITEEEYNHKRQEILREKW
jgi:hypothetical protein